MSTESPTISLEPVTLEDLIASLPWRNQVLETLRTSRALTPRDQEKFWRNLPNLPHRYWSVIRPQEKLLVGIAGLTNIQMENGIAEISLIVAPEERRKGIARQAANRLLQKAFLEMRLETVFGECYECNYDAVQFWLNWAKPFKAYTTVLPRRKFWKDLFYNSIYFSIEKENALQQIGY